jgi:protein-disulfide isomerase
VVVLVMLGLLSVTSVAGEVVQPVPPKDLPAEIEALKEDQAKILQELQEIKGLLNKLLQKGGTAAAGMPKNLVLSVNNDPFKGSPTARVTLIEFSDYQCPFCARHVRETFPQIERDYIATGKVKYVFRDFPLTAIHKQAFKAAEAANCAGVQDKYWDMHDRLFRNTQAMAINNFEDHARALGLEMDSFRQCLERAMTAKEIQEDLAEGQKAGVRGTPTFFIGLTDPNGFTVKPLTMLRGARPYQDFQEALDSLLAPTSK